MSEDTTPIPQTTVTDSDRREIRSAPRPRCFLCDSEGELLYAGLMDRHFDAPGEWSMKRCSLSSCGLLWLDPMPVPEDLHLAYRTYFTHGAGMEARAVSTPLRRILFGAYTTLNYLPSVMGGLRGPQQRIESMFLDDVTPGRVLDVGCGDGTFLHRIRSAGWRVEGFDTDEQALEVGNAKYGLDLRYGSADAIDHPEDSFDAVTVSHVIEHAPDPLALLRECRRILKPGGRLVVTTPNSTSWGHGRFQAYWSALDPPRHLHLFSVHTLRECAEKTGLVVLNASSTAARAATAIGASYSIRDTADHHMDTSRPNAFRALRALIGQYQEHWRLGANPLLGEEVVLIAGKPLG